MKSHFIQKSKDSTAEKVDKGFQMGDTKRQIKEQWHLLYADDSDILRTRGGADWNLDTSE